MTDAIEITAEEREALCDQIVIHLSGLDDLRLALDIEDFERVERLGVEFCDELRLMEDLGWGHPPAVCAIKLTMPPEQLHRVFTHLRSTVESLQRSEERERAEIANEAHEQCEGATRITQACDRVLRAIGRTPPPPLQGEAR